jgi:hypothetical protein
MGMPAGLKKSTNYFNKLEAWLDWTHVERLAIYFDLRDEAIDLAPSSAWPWKKIDAQTHKLRALIEPLWKAQTDKPLPWPNGNGHTPAADASQGEEKK